MASFIGYLGAGIFLGGWLGFGNANKFNYPIQFREEYKKHLILCSQGIHSHPEDCETLRNDDSDLNFQLKHFSSQENFKTMYMKFLKNENEFMRFFYKKIFSGKIAFNRYPQCRIEAKKMFEMEENHLKKRMEELRKNLQ
jgi:hypothetical protein